MRVNEFMLTAISSDGSSYDDQNTLIRFTNILPTPINLEGDGWLTCLTSIYIHNELKNPIDDTVKYLKVYCAQLDPIQYQEKCLAVFDLPKAKKEGTTQLYFEPKLREYFRLSTSFIERLDFHLEAFNYKGKPIPYFKLHTGQPTVINLHFKKKPAMVSEYVIRAESKSPWNFQPELNKANQFSCCLGPGFSLDPTDTFWEIGVTSISYMPEMRPNVDSPFLLEVITNDGSSSDYSGLCHETFDYDINQKDVHKFITYINNILKQVRSKRKQNPKIYIDSTRGNENRLYLLNSSNKHCYLRLPLALFYNIGFRNFSKKSKNRLGQNIFRIMNNALWMFLPKGEKITAEVDFDPIAYNPEVGVIYCDAVNPSIVGGQEVPILKTFPISKKIEEANGYITHNFQTPEFHMLNQFDLSTLKFSLRDFSGSLLPFKNEDANVIITLILRNKLLKPSYVA